MNPIIIDGKMIASNIMAQLKQKPAPRGFVAVFVSTHDTISDSFVKQKEKISGELGIEMRRYEVLPDDTNDSLRERVLKVARAKRCVGVVLQSPLPASCDIRYIANAIPPHKDLDCLSARAIGAVYQEKAHVIPPAIRVVCHILSEYKKTISDFSNVSVVGQGLLVGKPLGVWLSGHVSHIHLLDKGFDMESLKESDLIILGTGNAGLIRGEYISSGAWVIDFGYDARSGKLSGDLDAHTVSHLGLYTPTPGGTGPILVASLFENIFAV